MWELCEERRDADSAGHERYHAIRRALLNSKLATEAAQRDLQGRSLALPEEKARHSADLADRDLELVVWKFGPRRRRHGKGPEIVVVEAPRVVVAHVAVAHAQFVLEGERHVLAWRPAARGDGVADAEAEARDCWREGRFPQELGVDDVGFLGLRVGRAALGGEESDGWVVGRWFTDRTAECEAVLYEPGGYDGYFHGEVGAWEEAGGVFADEDFCGAGRVEDVAGVEVGEHETGLRRGLQVA